MAPLDPDVPSKKRVAPLRGRSCRPGTWAEAGVPPALRDPISYYALIVRSQKRVGTSGAGRLSSSRRRPVVIRRYRSLHVALEKRVAPLGRGLGLRNPGRIRVRSRPNRKRFELRLREIGSWVSLSDPAFNKRVAPLNGHLSWGAPLEGGAPSLDLRHRERREP